MNAVERMVIIFVTLVILGALMALIAGCANIPADPKERVVYDQCSHKAVNAYVKSHYDNGGTAGTIVGGALLGPLGAAVGNNISNPNQMKPGDIDPAIDKCMADGGYPGFAAVN